MDAIIKTSLQHSMSYQEYRSLVSRLVELRTTTGNEKTEDLINYTMLNDRRMQRWDKTLKVPLEIIRIIKDFDNKVTWLVITESWCGDAAHILPVINKIAELNSHIDFRIVIRDDHNDLMNMFLTHGNRAVPKLIMIDEATGQVIETYGPRPSIASSFVNDFKAEHGKLTLDFKEDLQHWYNKNKGENIIDDLVKIICRIEPSLCL